MSFSVEEFTGLSEISGGTFILRHQDAICWESQGVGFYVTSKCGQDAFVIEQVFLCNYRGTGS